ncbi:hypothetical protein PAAG_07778 [Paracoccidioides lutzii Pb01]|uniref:Uncharacterized protein n=1 Tax=Paracoccidioides lutzii (strain ATCC MYA-826 / Pb01) TaxID=502779 RepID=C1HA49_PARBA|nr:hypothetical protein PAAG_07778 [Paracoccidioides lutzii Pb01]EEH37222.1 hypothetical protein PAAG_07778 [Paracoccidioides lutzii Pb01]
MFKSYGMSARLWTSVVDSAVTKWNQGAATAISARLFSSSSSGAAENDDDSRDRLNSSRGTARRQTDDASYQSSSPTPLIRRIVEGRPTTRQQQPFQQQHRRPLDARALGAEITQAGGKPTNLLRAPATLRKPGSNISRLRTPKRPATIRPARRQRQGKSSKSDSGGGAWTGHREMSKEEQEAEEKAYLEQWERERPKPVRYIPHGYNLDNLQRTWPALPMGETGPKEALHERLAWMSERYPNGFEPMDLLAKRIHEGKWTYFYSDEEKNEAVELARKMETERADKLTDRKGTVVEPEDMSFQPMNETQKKQLVSRLVSGEYKSEKAQWMKMHATRHPVMQDVIRNLTNNSTWQASQKTMFLETLSKSLPQPKVARPKA